MNKIYLYDIIEDMINFSLITRLNSGQYEITSKKNIPSPLIRGILNKLSYINRINFDYTKFKYKNRLEEINNTLNEFIDKLEKDTMLKINKNNCEKRLKHYPF